MKILFLDIDGVLINNRFASRNMADPRCVEELNRITDKTGAKIVVSSSWKHYGLPKITLILKQWGVTGDIIDITPNDKIGAVRAIEIQSWILDNEPFDAITKIVVIDDEPFAAPGSKNIQVTPDFQYGLNVIDADRAIAILEGIPI